MSARSLAVYFCLGLFLFWLLILLMAVWGMGFDPEFFLRFTLTMVLVCVAVGAVILVVCHEKTEQRQKENNYLR